MSKKPGPNRENYKKTSQKFLDIAREEFIAHGYNNASTERIVEQSGMARGSLYYHYGNKEGLFKEVYKEVADEAAIRIDAQLENIENPLEALKTGCHVFFQECKRPDVRTIMLSEGIAHIVYQERIKILEDNLFKIMRRLVKNVCEQGGFKDFEPAVVLMFIFGTVAECGRSFEYFGQFDSVDDQIDCYKKNLNVLLDKIAC